jgi:hypothetical protein
MPRNIVCRAKRTLLAAFCSASSAEQFRTFPQNENAKHSCYVAHGLHPFHAGRMKEKEINWLHYIIEMLTKTRLLNSEENN